MVLLDILYFKGEQVTLMGWLTVFVNKVLLEHNGVRLFMYVMAVFALQGQIE